MKNIQRTIRASLAFLQLAVGLLITFSENVVAMLTGNLDYTNPFPALPTVTTAIDKLKAANLAAMDRSRTAIAIRNQAWEELLGLMRSLVAWVQANCQNNLAILVSSGFNPVQTRTPVGPLGPPMTPVLKQGPNTGTMTVRTRRMRGAYTYSWRIALASAPTVYLKTVLTTSIRHTFTGLTAGETYLVEVCGIGALGEGAFSPVIGMMVV